MSWFRVDDQASSHPKFIAAGYHAWGLWGSGGQYSSRHLTDGFVPAAALPILAPIPIVEAHGYMRKLVESDLWHETFRGEVIGCAKCAWREAHDPRLTRSASERAAMTGWLIHDYHDYNPYRVEVQKRRDHDAKRRGGGRSAPPSPDFPHGIRGESVGNVVSVFPMASMGPGPSPSLLLESTNTGVGTGRDGSGAADATAPSEPDAGPRTPEELRALIESAIPGYSASLAVKPAPLRSPAERARAPNAPGGDANTAKPVNDEPSRRARHGRRRESAIRGLGDS